MNFGFIIDNRKCIGCHACTVACKSEHEVPIGVNRTWVKYIEKGRFPHTRRLFSVMRCNHCANAPCVEICPTAALFTRSDGIVDFDNKRCIACKGCIQACPYDALFIDPGSHTAAKCNYCAHRIDIGLEPSCVVACPEQAIISGDLSDSSSEISRLLAREEVVTRKPEKNTQPKLFYIDGDEISLNPALAEPSANYLWSSQKTGVGHFTHYTEARIAASASEDHAANAGDRELITHSAVSEQNAKRVYDAPKEGTLWGWEVAAYVWTKAIATGSFLFLFLATLFGAKASQSTSAAGVAVGGFFLLLTCILLVMDLDQPRRFAYVLLRPQWRSWLVRGGYALFVYGLLLFATGIGLASSLPGLDWVTGIFAVVSAVYTAFLFAQAKGRDFWQSPILPLHMLVHALLAGGAFFGIYNLVEPLGSDLQLFLLKLLPATIIANVLIVTLELATPHATRDARMTAHEIFRGRYRLLFWVGTIILGNVAPLGLLFLESQVPMAMAGLLLLIGIYCTEHIWVKAPQDAPLS